MRRRVIPPVDELLEALREAGVEDAPREGPDPDALQGILDLALWVADHRKRVSFPAFDWADPAFLAADGRVTLRVAYARPPADFRPHDLGPFLAAQLPRVARGNVLLAMDGRAAGLREFDLSHQLYGEVTLYSWPAKPPEPADPRIDAARERGWARVLKEHNLLPGRGLVVLDEHQGLLLREDALHDLLGTLVLLPRGETLLWWNPFVREEKNDPELQHWLAWGEGTSPPSYWRQLLHVEDGERD